MRSVSIPQSVPATKTFYIALEEARETLRSRQRLRNEVEAWWQENGWGAPPIPEDDNLGILARQMWTGRGEDVLFYIMAQRAGLTPCFSSYLGDHFIRTSNLKLSYIQPTLFKGLGKRSGKPMTERVPLARVEVCEKHSLKELRWQVIQRGRRSTNTGLEYPHGIGSLADLHAQHQDLVFGEAPLRFDITSWYRRIGPCREYYRGLLSLYIAHGVLFEDYFGGESGGMLDAFTRDIFLPAWQEVTERFGVQPMMVRLPWWTELGWYPRNRADWENPRHRAILLRDF